MKRWSLILTAFFFPFLVFGQNISEDAEGNGSIIMPVGNFSFNSTKTEIKAGYLQGCTSGEAFLKSIRPKVKKADTLASADLNFHLSELDKINLDSRFFGGGFVSGKNEDGIAELIGDGKFTAGFGAEALFGLKLYPYGDRFFRRFDSIEDYNDSEKIFLDTIAYFQKSFDTAIGGILTYLNDSKKEIKLRYPDLSVKTGDSTLVYLDSVISLFTSLNEINKWGVKATACDSIVSRIGRMKNNPHLSKEFAQYMTDIREEIKDPLEELKLVEHWKKLAIGAHNIIFRNTSEITMAKRNTKYFSIYLKGNCDRKEFNLFQPTQSSPTNIYLDTNFFSYGFSGNLNLTFPDKRLVFGFSAGYEHIDNYDDLKPITINSTTTTYTDSTRTDKTTKNIDAMKGTYRSFNNLPFMFDALWMIRPQKSDNIVALGVYGRYNKGLPEKDFEVYDSWAAGITMNLFNASKGRFINGIYFQSANQTGGEDKKDKFGKTITVGMTFKINLFKFDYDRMFPGDN